MARFDHLKGVFGLLPTPYNEDYEINTPDLRAAADFCCRSGQHGIVWPVMVGEFYFLGEDERIRNLDAVLEEVNGRLPVVFGCSGVSVPQVLLFARAAQRADADAIIAMAPARTNQAIAQDMFRRLADAFHGPDHPAERRRLCAADRPTGRRACGGGPPNRVREGRTTPGPKHIAEVHRLAGERIKTIFGGAAGKFLPDELHRGANGCMPACEVADLLAKVMERWWAGDEESARDLHRRLLPLINLETHPFMRYILKRRGVFTSTVERAPAGADDLDADDKREISRLLKAIEGDVDHYPFGPE